jgi:hypothetical protein
MPTKSTTKTKPTKAKAPKAPKPAKAAAPKKAAKTKDSLTEKPVRRLSIADLGVPVAKPRTRKADAVEPGVIPPPPDFSAKTHERFRGKLAQVVELANARDLAGLTAFQINPVSSSPKAILKYRDRCIAALEAAA